MSKIISAGNPILKNVAAPVEVFDKKLKFLVIDMKKTLYEANGVGLAAPQIAVSKRVFVADDGESGFEAYINPEWSPIGDEKNAYPFLNSLGKWNAIRMSLCIIRIYMARKKQKRHPGY